VKILPVAQIFCLWWLFQRNPIRTVKTHTEGLRWYPAEKLTTWYFCAISSFTKNRCVDSHSFLQGQKDILPHFLHFSWDLD